MLSDHWVILGGGPSAAAYARRDGVCVMTTNHGLSIERNPDFYYLNDHVACEMFHDDSRRAQREGTRLVAVNRKASGISLRKLHGADLWLDCIHVPDAKYPYTRGAFTYHPLSGCMCVQFAVFMGAKQIDLYGFEGYADGGRLESKNPMQAELLQNVVEKCPDISFVWHGQPRYEIVGRNVGVSSLV